VVIVFYTNKQKGAQQGLFLFIPFFDVTSG
jgi:hypothetical protein